jgi:hypothetical protein
LITVRDTERSSLNETLWERQSSKSFL